MGHPKRSKHPSEWSKWKWSFEHRCYTRFRRDSKENLEWDYSHDGDTKSSYSRADNSQTAQSIPKMDSRSTEYTGTEDVAQHSTSMSMNSVPDSGGTTPTQTWSPSAATLPSQWAEHSGHTRIKTKNPGTRHEEQDEKFKVQNSALFKFGKVFKVLWSEPRGANGTDITARTGNAYTKVRRFVIVNNFKGHCLCLPILTYTGQGTLKRGIQAKDHAIVYTDIPYQLQGEELKKQNLQMEPYHASEKLDPASRVNYGKVYTVEHNVKVRFIGKLTPDAQVYLTVDYNRAHPPLSTPELEPKPESSYTTKQQLDWGNSSTQNNDTSATQMTLGGQTPRALVGQVDYTTVPGSALQPQSAPTYDAPVPGSSYSVNFTGYYGASMPATGVPCQDETPEQVNDYSEFNLGEEDLYSAQA